MKEILLYNVIAHSINLGDANYHLHKLAHLGLLALGLFWAGRGNMVNVDKKIMGTKNFFA